MTSKSKQRSKGNSDEEKQHQASQGDGVERSALPFEPTQTRKQTTKQASAAKQTPTKHSGAKNAPKAARSSSQPVAKRKGDAGVPAVVSSRMVRRMAFFSGLPTALGMLTFVASYIVVSNEWLKVPNVAVVLVSMGCFGLGVLGLTYGVISASWDEERVGTRLGWGEFTTNFGRVVESWRSRDKEPNA